MNESEDAAAAIQYMQKEDQVQQSQSSKKSRGEKSECACVGNSNQYTANSIKATQNDLVRRYSTVCYLIVF